MFTFSQAAKLPLRVKYCFFILLFINHLFTSVSYAGAGHDHGTDETKATPTTPIVPRLVMESNQFELVGVLEGKDLYLYLDDFTSNAPIPNAKVELEVAGKTWQAVTKADGRYHIQFDNELKEDIYPVLATITTNKATDLLIADLDVHHAEKAPHTEKNPVAQKLDSAFQLINPSWVASGTLPVLLLIIFVLLRDRKQQKAQHE